MSKIAGSENITLTIFEKKYIFFIDDVIGTGGQFVKNFQKYEILFDDEDWRVREAVAANLNACNSPKYKIFHKKFEILFNDEDWRVRRAVAGNTRAISFFRYKKLFNDEDPEVICAVGANPKAISLSEYKELIQEKKYNGVMITGVEYYFMKALEKQAGKIPKVSEKKLFRFGFAVKNNHIIGIALDKKEIISIPETIGSLNISNSSNRPCHLHLLKALSSNLI